MAAVHPPQSHTIASSTIHSNPINSPTKPRLSILPLPSLEPHISRIMEIQFSAFDNEPYHEVLFPGGNNPSARDAAGKRTIAEKEHTPQQEVLAAVNEKGELVGFVKWNFYREERGEDEWKKREPIDWCGDDEELKRKAEVFVGATCGIRERIWEGRRHALCALLCVHQDHQRKGAGTLLMNWGVAKAKELGLPVYLEASHAGEHLYCKLGFKQIDEMVVSKEVSGLDHDRAYKAMLLGD